MIEQINNENFKAWIFWFIDSIKNYDKNFPNQTLLSKVALTTSKKSSRAAEITISNSSLVLKYCIFIIVQFPLTDYINLSIRCIKIGKFGLKQLFFLTTHSYSDKDTSMQQLFLLLGKKSEIMTSFFSPLSLYRWEDCRGQSKKLKLVLKRWRMTAVHHHWW